MNILKAEKEGISKFGPVSESDEGLTVPRIKPLIYIPERECAYYCELKGLDYYSGGCPYSTEAFRGLAKDFLNDAEQKYPGIKFNVLKSYLSMRKLIGKDVKGAVKKPESLPSVKCESCGGKSAGRVCRACQMIAFISKAKKKSRK
jgi:uncharacterized protein (TIGR00269 family)